MEARPEHARQIVALVGATGFVGKAVARRLTERGIAVRTVTAPRLSQSPGVTSTVSDLQCEYKFLRDSFVGCSAVINAAGVADSSAVNAEAVWGANAVLPNLIASAARSVGARTVHVSSAAVQGRKRTLDSSDQFDGFSLYSRSKIAGEEAARTGDPDAVVYRPPGVHGPGRPVTVVVRRLARSPLSSVAAPGTDNAPQAQIENVADAIAFLATTESAPAKVVTHPSEGITTSQLLQMLGKRSPFTLPRFLARTAVTTAFAIAKLLPPLVGHARRLEVLWFGQDQAPSWLTEAGWLPVVGVSGWTQIGNNDKPVGEGSM